MCVHKYPFYTTGTWNVLKHGTVRGNTTTGRVYAH